jgi:hypothetical protein
METLLKTKIGWKQAALAAIAAAAIGCGGQVSTASTTNELAAAELPDVGGCAEVARAGAAIKWQPVAGVRDLYVVKLGGRTVCIDSSEGVRAAFGTRAYAASNPMPGDPGTAASNPMPGDPGDPGTGDAASNPMPGDDGSSSSGDAASNPMPGDNASGSSSHHH